jgi:hypothetical protein
LDKFECTKCVHVSTLKFLDSMMFYMFRGFQRLQICNFWTLRTKDMKLLLKQIGLIQFENEFNLNTENIKYYCTNGFYILLSFQWYKVCNFWTHGFEVMNFQRFSTNLIWISNLYLFKFRSRHVADSYSSVPVRTDHHREVLDLK